MSLYEFVERPDLESPVLILALDGWIDAGLGAANARAALLAGLDPVTVATFDSDQLLDHIPLLIREEDSVLPVFDSTRTLARAALREAAG